MTLYWVGGTGNWDQATTTHWASSSGGAGGVQVPTASDDVIFDGNSGAGTVTLTANGPCRSIQSAGSSLLTFVHNSSVTLSIGTSTPGPSNIMADFSGFTTYTIGSNTTSIIAFISSSAPQQTIKTGGLTMPTFNLSNFTSTPSLLFLDNFTAKAINQNGGIINTNGFTVTVPSWGHGGAGSRTTTITNSIINLTATSGTLWGTTSTWTLNAAGSTINITAASASTRTFTGGGKAYGTLTYTVAGSTGQLTVTGANTFDALNFSDASNARTIQFPASTTQTFTAASGFNIQGTATKLMSIISSSSGTPATISVASGTVQCDYLSIKDSTATGGAAFNAGAHSTNVSGNTGWNFAASQAPIVTDSAATNIINVSAQGNGNVVADGGATITERGFVLSTNSNPTTSDTKYIVAGTTGAYNGSMTGLSQGTTYHYRAYAINSQGTSYGADQSFTTLVYTLPTVTDSAATFIDNQSAVFSGNITSNGNTTITESGFVWGLSANPTTSSNVGKQIVTVQSGVFTAFIPMLSPTTTYHYRAYAINSVGTSYGVDQVFTTLTKSPVTAIIDSNFGFNLDQEFQAGPEVFGSTFPVSQLNSDLTYLWNLGIRNVRIPLKQWGSRSIDIAWQQQAAAQVKAFGFNVILGSGQHATFKPQDWDTFITYVTKSEVPWVLANGFGASDCYMLGNENDNGSQIDDFVSATRTSNVITVVYGFKHSMATGDTIDGQFLDLSQSSFTGKVVTVIDAFTFSFASNGSNGTITGGNTSRNYWKLGTFGVENIIKRLSTTVKAISGFNLFTSYSVLQGVIVNNGTPETDTYNISNWVTNGRGTIDFIDLNMYSDTATPDTNPALAYRFFTSEIKVGFNGFGASHFRISEWNIWQDTSHIPSPASLTTSLLLQRLNFLKSLSLQHFFFCYRYYDGVSEFLNVVKPFNKTTGLLYRDWWWAFVGQEQRQPTQERQFNTPTAIALLRTSPIAIVNSTTNFNYGGNWQSGTAFYNSTIAATDFAFLSKIGVKKIRIGIGDFTFADGVAASKLGILQAVAAGFTVIVNINGPATDANWSSVYTPNVLTLVSWCQANGVSIVEIGNELEGNKNLTNLISKLLVLGTSAKSLCTTTLVSYAILQDHLESSWEALGSAGIAGSLDKLGYNAYGDTLNLQNQTVDDVEWQGKINAMQAAFGSQLYLSEWNLPYTWPFPVSDAVQATQLIARVAFLKSINMENYFFTYSWTNNNDFYGFLKSDGTYRSWSQALFINPIPRTATVSRPLAGVRPSIVINT